MNIHILPVAKPFQPDRQNFVAPAHNEQWGVEQDFPRWLLTRPHLCAARPEEADWDYLPIYWNRYYINNQWGSGGLRELQAEIQRLVVPHRWTFTICEYDLPGLQPFLNLRGMVVFTASRRSADPKLIDIPLLCSPHERGQTDKRWLAAFNGNIETDGIRIEMTDVFRHKSEVFIGGHWMDPPKYAELLESAYVALAPRGQGAQSFRFYEAMQLGTVPMLLSDIDSRPFQKWIDWETCSLWARTPGEAADILDNGDRETFLEMGRRARQTYVDHLQYGEWCRYVLKELECRTP